MNMNPEQSVNMLQNMLLNKFIFTTGDPLLDPLIHMLIYTFISMLIFNLQSLLNFTEVITVFKKIVNWGCHYYYQHMKGEDEFFNKHVILDHITDNKKVNNLYKAVDWYLSTKYNTDFIKESPLKLTFEEDPLEVKPNDLKLNRRLTQNQTKSLNYKNHEIFYILNNNLITVYADKERKRENFTISLTTKMRKDSQLDIIDDFCQMCLTEYVKSKKSDIWVQKIFVNNSKGEWVSHDSNNRRKLDTVILQDNMLNDIKKDIDDFKNSEEWYHDRDIPYTRGYLLYGRPGTGKTSLIKGISTYTKRHMHYLMLNNVHSDNDLLNLLKNIKYKETILIIEDIDCMTKIIKDRTKNQEDKDKDTDTDEKYKKIEKELQEIKKHYHDSNSLDNNLNNNDNDQLTLSGLLNAIDGIFNNDGRILIMTTNHPEVLDDALIRSGRIDRKIFFDYCTRKQINDIHVMMFDCECSIEQLNNIEEYKYSPADITSLLLRYRTEAENALLNINKVESSPKINDKLTRQHNSCC